MKELKEGLYANITCYKGLTHLTSYLKAAVRTYKKKGGESRASLESQISLKKLFLLCFAHDSKN